MNKQESETTIRIAHITSLIDLGLGTPPDDASWLLDQLAASQQRAESAEHSLRIWKSIAEKLGIQLLAVLAVLNTAEREQARASLAAMDTGETVL